MAALLIGLVQNSLAQDLKFYCRLYLCFLIDLYQHAFFDSLASFYCLPLRIVIPYPSPFVFPPFRSFLPYLISNPIIFPKFQSYQIFFHLSTFFPYIPRISSSAHFQATKNCKTYHSRLSNRATDENDVS